MPMPGMSPSPSQVLSSYRAHASAPALVQGEVIGRYIAGFDAFLTSMQVSIPFVTLWSKL